MFYHFITKYNDIFCWQNERSFSIAKASHFFNKKYWHIWDSSVWNLNETTNDVVSFEQPVPGECVYFQGKQLCFFSFLSPFSVGKEFAPFEQGQGLKEKTHIGRTFPFRKAYRKSQKLFLFEKLAEKHGSVPVHLAWREQLLSFKSSPHFGKTCPAGPGCSKLTTSLVNVPLKFQTLISEIS